MARFVVSSYEVTNSLSLLEIDFERNKYAFLKNYNLFTPSFVIADYKYIFTFSKNPLKLIAYDYNLNLIDEIEINLLSSTHLCYNSNNYTLYGASYLDGALYSVVFKNNKFSNLNIKIIENSKCHCVTLFKNNEIICTDINNDALYIFDECLNILKTYHLDKGSGPRHTIVTTENIFVICEYTNEVYMLNYDGKILSKCLSTYESSNGATLFALLDKIYVSNRLNEKESTVSVFSTDNKLKLVSEFSIYGKNSRHMIRTNDGKYLLSCNLDSNNITIIDIEKKELVLTIPYQKVSCICEIK